MDNKILTLTLSVADYESLKAMALEKSLVNKATVQDLIRTIVRDYLVGMEALLRNENLPPGAKTNS